VRCHGDEETYQEKARPRDAQARDEAGPGVQANDPYEDREADGIKDPERWLGATRTRAP
jgi:hypothetical protein